MPVIQMDPQTVWDFFLLFLPPKAVVNILTNVEDTLDYFAACEKRMSGKDNNGVQQLLAVMEAIFRNKPFFFPWVSEVIFILE